MDLNNRKMTNYPASSEKMDSNNHPPSPVSTGGVLQDLLYQKRCTTAQTR